MKKFLLIAVLLLVLSIVTIMPVTANPPMLNWGQQLNGGQCVETENPVINVVQNVLNSIDSGEDGNYWAFDDFVRQIQVWGQADGSYCVIVRSAGHFDSQAGQRSPGQVFSADILSGNEDGSFEGGYRANIEGTLLAAPEWPTTGNIGTTDYQCDLSGDCENAVNWVDQYFESGYSFAYEWWGWVYHGGRYGTWVNSVDGNSGDILDG